MNFSARGMIDIFNQQTNNLTGVEIGVDKGKTTKGLIDFCQNIKKIYAVDPWKEYKALDQKTCDFNFMIAKENLAELIKIKKVEIIKLPSLEAVKLFDNLSLDFIYIDGEHTFSAVYSDLAAWYPKIKLKGIIAGHDFRPGKDLEVKAAVRKFTQDNNINLTIVPDGWSWYFYKANLKYKANIF